MRVKLTENQIKQFEESFDIVLKAEGLGIIDQVENLINTINNPAENNEETKELTYDLSEEQFNDFMNVLDLTLKEGGIKVLFGVKGLLNVFQNPIKEEVQEETTEEAEVLVEQ